MPYHSAPARTQRDTETVTESITESNTAKSSISKNFFARENMAYKRTKTGSNSYTTYNSNTGRSTLSHTSGTKSLRITQSNTSDGKSYTTTTTNLGGGWYSRTRVNNNPTVKYPKTPKVRHSRSRSYSRTRYKPMSFKYTPQLLLICIILIAFGFVLEKLGF